MTKVIIAFRAELHRVTKYRPYQTIIFKVRMIELKENRMSLDPDTQ